MKVETTPWIRGTAIEDALRTLGLDAVDVDTANKTDDVQLRLHASLALTLQQAIAQEVSLADVVKRWHADSKVLIERQRQHRRTAILVSLEQAMQSPGALAAACHDHCGVTAIESDAAVPPPTVEPFFRLLATKLLTDDEALASTAALLTASSLPLTNVQAPSATADAMPALERYLTGQAALNEQPDLREKLNAAEQQIEALKKERDRHYHAEQAQRDQYENAYEQLKSAQQESNQRQQEVERLKRAMDQLNERNAQMIEQIHTLQEHIEDQALSASAEASETSEAAPEPTPAVFEPIELDREERKGWEIHLKRIRQSELFDAKWYLARYPDVAAHRQYRRDPARHFLLFGGFEGRHPGPAFDAVAYYQDHPDVYQNRAHPLVHYIENGHAENRVVRRPSDH